MSEFVKVKLRDSVALVTLNNPTAMNAIHSDMRDAVIQAMSSLNSNSLVRAIVITGAEDRAFSAGQDLSEAAGFAPEEVPAWMDHQRRMFESLRGLDKPLVAAFNGLAVGTGFQMGLLADVRVGYPEMSIGQPEVRVGLASILGSYLMSLYLGQGHNMQMSLEGKLIDGVRAAELGLLTYVTPKETVLEKAFEVAEDLARLPVNALRLTKERFRTSTQADFDQACEAVSRYHTEEYQTGEPQKIMNEFLERRMRRREQRHL